MSWSFSRPGWVPRADARRSALERVDFLCTSACSGIAARSSIGDTRVRRGYCLVPNGVKTCQSTRRHWEFPAAATTTALVSWSPYTEIHFRHQLLHLAGTDAKASSSISSSVRSRIATQAAMARRMRHDVCGRILSRCCFECDLVDRRVRSRVLVIRSTTKDTLFVAKRSHCCVL